MTLPTIPLLCVVIAYVLVYLPHFAAGKARIAMGFDNNYPRDQSARLEGWARRASAAHQNGQESFAPFAISVVVSLVGHASEHTVTLLTVAYVVCRLTYIGAYLSNLASLRSAVWFGGFGITIALLLLPLFS